MVLPLKTMVPAIFRNSLQGPYTALQGPCFSRIHLCPEIEFGFVGPIRYIRRSGTFSTLMQHSCIITITVLTLGVIDVLCFLCFLRLSIIFFRLFFKVRQSGPFYWTESDPAGTCCGITRTRHPIPLLIPDRSETPSPLFE